MTQIVFMRVLLIGEYSRFHNSLKEGLIALGHDVVLVGTGDAFKNYPVDINIKPNLTTCNWFITRLKNLIYRLTKVDISRIETGMRFWKQRHKMKEYDVVQFINSWSIRTTFKREKKYIIFLEKHNKALFLSACGTDVPFVKGLFETPYPYAYSLVSPYLKDKQLAKHYNGTLKYLEKAHEDLFEFITHKVRAIIPADVDYLWGLRNTSKTTSLVPMPINTDLLKFTPLQVDDKIVIFHGINRINYIKKGNNFFEEALRIVERKYPNKVAIIIAESMPYDDYIKAYDGAHILLDQATSLDQGYNAREAMAKGKVVFTGAETAFTDQYQLKETVAINATPNTDQIVQELEQLILNPSRIPEIGRNARAFIEREHHYIKVAQRYIDLWTSH